MRRLFDMSQRQLLEVLDQAARRHESIFLDSPDMPPGYRGNGGRAMITVARKKHGKGGGVEMRLNADSEFTSPLRTVERLLRLGHCSWNSKEQFANWAHFELRRAYSEDQAQIEAERDAAWKSQKESLLERASNSPIEAPDSLDTQWWTRSFGGEWKMATSFGETVTRFTEWLDNPRSEGKRFERGRLLAEQRSAVTITYPEAEPILVVASDTCSIEMWIARAKQSGASAISGVGLANIMPTVEVLNSGRGVEIFQAPMRRKGLSQETRTWEPNGGRTARQFSITPSEQPMRMTREVYEQIVATVGSAPAETGGILGGSYEDGLITEFHFDAQAKVTGGTYEPDTEVINATLKNDWNPKGIRLLGVVHSHPRGYRSPTVSGSNDPHSSDFAYIKSILARIDASRNADPVEEQGPRLERMYLPIVMSGVSGPFELLPFAVGREGDGYCMETMQLEIVETDNAETEAA